MKQNRRRGRNSWCLGDAFGEEKAMPNEIEVVKVADASPPAVELRLPDVGRVLRVGVTLSSSSSSNDCISKFFPIVFYCSPFVPHVKILLFYFSYIER